MKAGELAASQKDCCCNIAVTLIAILNGWEAGKNLGQTWVN
jgi:hypothetical protein